MDDIMDYLEMYLDELRVDYEISYMTDRQIEVNANLDEMYWRDLGENVYDDFPQVEMCTVYRDMSGAYQAMIQIEK